MHIHAHSTKCIYIHGYVYIHEHTHVHTGKCTCSYRSRYMDIAMYVYIAWCYTVGTLALNQNCTHAYVYICVLICAVTCMFTLNFRMWSCTFWHIMKSGCDGRRLVHYSTNGLFWCCLLTWWYCWQSHVKQLVNTGYALAHIYIRKYIIMHINIYIRTYPYIHNYIPPHLYTLHMYMHI